MQQQGLSLLRLQAAAKAVGEVSFYSARKRFSHGGGSVHQATNRKICLISLLPNAAGMERVRMGPSDQLLKGYPFAKSYNASCSLPTARELSPEGGARVEDSEVSAPTLEQDPLQVASLRILEILEGGSIV